MVKLNKIYTRTGDDGTTGLATGARVRKDNLRVEVYGTVDEANAFVGIARTLCDGPIGAAIEPVLRAIQHDLFDAGADLATPVAPGEQPGKRLRVLPGQTTRLEPIIDTFNKDLAPLTSFVLPGGSPLAASLHAARTVVRRAERLAVTLMAEEPKATTPEPMKYLNRLSDLLFVLARAANRNGLDDVLWVPGANRGH